MDDLPSEIKQKIEIIDNSKIPHLLEHQVYKKIKSMKIPNSSIPNDIPKKIIEEFSVELSNPITILFNNILKNIEFADLWKKEIGIPLPKISNPLN